MYQVRLLSTKYARFFERIYDVTYPMIVASLKIIDKTTKGKLTPVITWVEKQIKGFFFDCKMCGHCILSSTGMTCPMNCPKNIRNGPCGGVRANGNCEVKPEMKCVWVQAWQGAERMKKGHLIQTVQFAVDAQQKGTSSWLHIARGEKEAPHG